MADPALGLLRFDFVLGAEDDAVVDDLERRFGDPVEAAMWGDALEGGRGDLTFDVDGPDELGLPPEFGDVTLRVAGFADAVTGLITFASVDATRSSVAGSAAGDGADPVRIRAWERQLGAVRSLVPGEERGPETTVFWVGADRLPDGPAARPFELAEARSPPPDDEPDDASGPFGARPGGGLRLPGDETLLLPRDRGQPWGTLLAVDLDDHLRSTVASGGRRLHGPWSELGALYGIHYWCRARGAELAALEDRVAAAAAGLPTPVGEVDPGEFVDWDATVVALEEDWNALGGRVGAERRRLSRLLEDCSVRLDARTRGRSGTDDESALLSSYVERLARDLEEVQSDVRRIDDRLDSVTAAFRGRVSLVAALATAEHGRRVGDGTGGRRLLDDRSGWLAGAAVALVVVLAADVLMTGGLETFVDRLFDRGLGAVTTQVVAGVVLVGLALATVVLLRRRGDARR